MDPRLAAAPVVPAFAEAIRPLTHALYVGGSLASGDYRPGISDLDLCAVVPREPDERQLVDLHRALPGADLLHCAYLPLDDLHELGREHLIWAHQELYRRPFGAIARAELFAFGLTVHGPPPADLLPPVDDATVRAAARDELSGYWAGASAKPELWQQAVYVDHGLTTLARAAATIATGRLISKQEAIDDLHRHGVPAELIGQIRRRRAGETVAVSPADAELSRRIMIEQTARILA
ncbi:nucleotidyltransferase domain-containing protein [Actinoplanes sp. ATCC 53533]|uniref:nucleotidyltransferase domain-containing protein n=1 Tax=Actinoplanes sp. ATCC 53533 TaxID=1288362 RepID=UPI001315210B|nr:nucleotidyltransferase domain-containing protein [Actinoplanes sp. ATCC 53533]